MRRHNVFGRIRPSVRLSVCLSLACIALIFLNLGWICLHGVLD